MTWFKVDDGFADHPKVEALLEGAHAECAIALWVTCGSWCAKHLTDGFVPMSRVKRSGYKHAEKGAAELVRVGLWEAGAGGFQFRGWSEYQPTRARVEADRAATAEKVRRHRKGSAEGLKQSVLERCMSACHYCGASLALSSMTIDHVLARKDGGSTSVENCVAACVSCNSKKKAGTLVTGYTCKCVTGYSVRSVQERNPAPDPTRPDQLGESPRERPSGGQKAHPSRLIPLLDQATRAEAFKRNISPSPSVLPQQAQKAAERAQELLDSGRCAEAHEAVLALVCSAFDHVAANPRAKFAFALLECVVAPKAEPFRTYIQPRGSV